LDGVQPWRFAGELPPVEGDHRFADGQFRGYLTYFCQGGRWQLVEQVIGDGLLVSVRLPVGVARAPGRGKGTRAIPRSYTTVQRITEPSATRESPATSRAKPT
jgi:hypothetical protein